MFRLRNWLIVGSLLLLGALATTFRAARAVPEFYEQAVELPPAQADAAGDEFAKNTLTLANEVREAGEWSALFTDEQVNGWLAAELPLKHPDLLPDGFWEPRVRFHEDGLQFGIRHRVAKVRTVVWVDVEVKMSGNQEAALRFRKVRAGSLPLPLGRLLDGVSELANDLQVPIRWTTIDGDPTAVIGLPALGKQGLRYDLDKLKVSEGRLFVSGRTTQLAASETKSSVR
jgi:hypothetical protein